MVVALHQHRTNAEQSGSSPILGILECLTFPATLTLTAVFPECGNFAISFSSATGNFRQHISSSRASFIVLCLRMWGSLVRRQARVCRRLRQVCGRRILAASSQCARTCGRRGGGSLHAASACAPHLPRSITPCLARARRAPGARLDAGASDKCAYSRHRPIGRACRSPTHAVSHVQRAPWRACTLEAPLARCDPRTSIPYACVKITRTRSAQRLRAPTPRTEYTCVRVQWAGC